MTVKYTPAHEWIQLEDHETAVVGITMTYCLIVGEVA